MEKHVVCSRCHEKFVPRFHSRYGQICPWCEEALIMTEKELSRKCGLPPMTELEVINYLKYWDDPVLFPTV